MSDDGILAVRLGAMGDIIHTLPAVASLKQSFPHHPVAWAVEERWVPLLEGNPFVNELFLVNRRSFSAMVELRRKLRSRRFSLAVDFQGLIKSALVASFAQPDRIYGLDRSCAREPLAALFYSDTAKPHSAHIVDRQLELATAAGAHNIVRSFAVPEGTPEGRLPSGDFVLANPFAGWKSKQWPLENYSKLGQQLATDCGLTLVLNGVEEINVAGTVSHVSGLPGLIDATRRAKAVIGVDSGPLHLAAALGKPGVAIFGPTDPARNGPYGGTFTVLRTPGAATTYNRESSIDQSMQAITADEVLEALKSRLIFAAAS